MSAPSAVQNAVIEAVVALWSDGTEFTVDDVLEVLEVNVPHTSVSRVLRAWCQNAILNRRSRKLTQTKKLATVGRKGHLLLYAVKQPGIKTDSPMDYEVLTVVTETAEKQLQVDIAALTGPQIEVLSEADGRYLLRIDGQIYQAKKLEW